MNDRSAPVMRRSEFHPFPTTDGTGLHAETPPVIQSGPLSGRFRARASHSPGVPHPSADADCIGRSMVGSDAQWHNSMCFIIFRTKMRRFPYCLHTVYF